MKNYLKVVLNLSLATVFLITNISANISMWPSGNILSREVKQSSILFRLQNGSNRINEFQKIAQSIFKGNQDAINLTVNDMIKILGKPNKASLTQLQYWLFDDATKPMAIVQINNDLITSYQIINNQ